MSRVPVTLDSMYTRFHACQVPCLPGSMLTGFHAYQVPCLPGSMLTGFQLRWVPRIPGSICYRFLYTGLSCVGFQACRVPFAPSYCVMNSNHAGLQPHRTPITPAPCSPGSMCCELHACRVPCTSDSMFYEFHARRVPCMPGYKYMLLVKVISIAGHIY